MLGRGRRPAQPSAPSAGHSTDSMCGGALGGMVNTFDHFIRNTHSASGAAGYQIHARHAYTAPPLMMPRSAAPTHRIVGLLNAQVS